MMHIRERKHRLQRDCYQGKVIVSFTFCVKDRNPLFSESTTVNIFRDLLSESANNFSCIIPAYYYMPDHLHIIVEGTQEEVNLLTFINHYKQRTGFWMSQNQSGVSWQKNFFDHIIRKDESLPEVIRYVLENPVRKGLVSNWRDYPFKGAIGCDLNDILEGMI